MMSYLLDMRSVKFQKSSPVDSYGQRWNFSQILLCGIGLILTISLVLTGQTDVQAQDSADESLVEKGSVTLSIGDGFVFGEDEPRPDEDRSSLDLYVQDIRYGASLAAFAGCTVPAQPMTSVGLPQEPSELIALLEDAPANLPKRDLWLLPKCTSQRLGIGLVKSRSGKVYKLWLMKLDGHPEALKRTVQIGYESIRVADGGGVLNLPKSEGVPDKEVVEGIRQALEIGALIPGDSFSRYINGDYVAVPALPDNSVPERDSHIALSDQLNSSVKMKNRGSLVAGKGIGPDGSVLLDAYGAIGVLGAMQGRIDLDSYGYIYIGGEMEGTLNLDSYCTVVLGKGLSGTVQLRSYTDMLIKGPITGTIDANGSCWCTLYFDGEFSEAELAAMSPAKGRGDFHQITLHIRNSDDLADGEHEGIGTWRKVIVGDPMWNKLK